MGSSLSKHSKKRKAIEAPPGQPMPTAQVALVTKVEDEAGDPTFDRPYNDPRARDDGFEFPLDQLELSEVTDDKLLELYLTAPRLHHYGGVRIVRISKSLVVKGGEGVAPSEAANMSFAGQTLHLRVPKIHRSFNRSVPDDESGGSVQSHFIVMDYVPGRTVEDCWESLSHDERESVALQIASMIDAMQSKALNDLPPGPLANPDGKAFEGPWFTDYGAGPFATLQDLENWCNHKINVCLRFQQIPPDTPRFQFRDQVLTHQDIAPRNLILDAQEKVWLIDWGCAGVYPRGFEQAAFAQQCWNDELSGMVFAKLSDRQEAITDLYRSIAYGLTTAALS